MPDPMSPAEVLQRTWEAIAATEGPASLDYADRLRLYPYTLPGAAVRFDNVDGMRRRVNASGSHYFDADAVRFFRARTDGRMFAGRFWVESRKYENPMTGESDPRTYHVAWVSDYNGHLSVEKLGEFLTLDRARSAARNLGRVVESL